MFQQTKEVQELKVKLQNCYDTNDSLKKKITQQEEDFNRKFQMQEEDHKTAIRRMKDEHEFLINHFKDDELDKLRGINIDLNTENKIKDEKIASLQKLIDVDADIIDIKQLVNDLLGKIPTMDIKNLTVSASQSK